MHAGKGRSFPYIAPFALYIVLLGFGNALALDRAWWYPLQFILVSGLTLFFSRHIIDCSAVRPLQSVAVGITVFFIWIIPDLTLESYRDLAAFRNALTGSAQSSLSSAMRSNEAFLAWRLAGTAILVPVIEELFWRGWMMRYLIASDFERVPPGAYSPLSFWLTAILFASEHGPYWDVGLVSGVIYNLWMIYRRNLCDCILAHAVTNLILGFYVIAFGQWQYWL